RELQRGTRRR
ncbi:hypothetical protein TGPRC2_222270C, partial [Toxoplasma gondii TgCatPRC2]